MILSLQIALKFHRGSNNNVLISLVSLIAIISITIGIAISIIALSAINGFKYELSHRILAIVPHVEIESVGTSIIDWLTVLKCIHRIPEIICANPYVNFSGVVEFNNKWHVVYVRSIDVTKKINKNTLLYFVEKNFSWKNFYEKKEQIILGRGISDALGIKVGDWITIIIAHNFRMDNKLLLSKKIRLQVAGILNLNSQLDCSVAVMSLSDIIQHLYHKTSNITGIAIKIDDIFSADRIARKIEKILNYQVDVRSWMDTYGYIYRDIQMVRVIIYLSMILIMIISCFNVIATLILSIKDKNYDIALICALGGQKILIRRVFFWYGLIIYIISGVIGTGLGIFISLNLTSLIAVCNDLLGNKILSKGIYFINFLPVKLNGWDILSVLGITLLLGVVTSWYTVLKTKKDDFSRILK